MLYFIGVMLLWFLLRVYCRMANSNSRSLPYELNRVYLDPYEAKEISLLSFAKIRPIDEVELSEDEVRRVLEASKQLSRSRSVDR